MTTTIERASDQLNQLYCIYHFEQKFTFLEDVLIFNYVRPVFTVKTNEKPTVVKPKPQLYYVFEFQV